MLKLTKPIKRELLANDMRIAIGEGPDTIQFWTKGSRTKYEVSLHSCFMLALCHKMEEEYREKMEDYEMRKAAGATRLRRPKKPDYRMFSKRLRWILQTKVNVR